ncbi:hypothetical protein BN938_1904 [Mucinivorans hirudinis]|uniref:Translocation and assembly module TamB C-terminal domain-containing protein n=1 Tax=Mucinivorans hirudinis TaxID=1433126 RepID=A0A060RD82_9BACT|nr:hypothetical protein BN938_1904 [Mucinivorans hirudinis]
MKKVLKFILSFVSILIIAMVSVPIIVSMLLQVAVVQNFAVRQVTEMLSKKAETVMSISRIDIEFFNRVVIDDLYVQDQYGDSLIYVKQLRVGIRGINFLTGKISLGSVDLDGGFCHLYEDGKIMNVAWVFDHFKPAVEPTNVPDFRLSAKEVNLINFGFKLRYFDTQPQQWGINFRGMDFYDLNMQGRNVEIFNYDINLSMERLTLKDRSGFYLEHFSSGNCGVNERSMHFSQVRLETGATQLNFNYIDLNYDNWYAYNDFVEKVVFDGDILPSRVSMKDLSYFIGQKPDNPFAVNFSGYVHGAIPRLRGRLSNVRNRNTTLNLDFAVEGLPDINKTRFELDVENLNTDAVDANSIVRDFAGVELGADLMLLLGRAQGIRVDGRFAGMFSDFTAHATARVHQGVLNGKLEFTPSHSERTRIRGALSTRDFGIGKLLNNKNLQNISFDTQVDALLSKGKIISVNAKGDVPHFWLAGYDYRGIKIDGEFAGRSYSGRVECADTNMNFSADGRFEMRGDVPAYNFTANLHRANLRALGINRRDSVSELAALFSTEGFGSSFENMNGTTVIDKIVYINHLDTVRADAITILSQNSDSLRHLSMKSAFADVDVRGTSSYSQIIDYITEAVKRYIPSTGTNAAKKKGADKIYDLGAYQVDVDVKLANKVASIFLPGMEIAPGTRLAVEFEPKADKFRLDLESDYIGNNNNYLSKLNLVGRNAVDSVYVVLNAAECELGNVYMPDFLVRGIIRGNTIDTRIAFDNKSDETSLDLRTRTHIYRTAADLPQVRIDVRPTPLTVAGKRWLIDSCYVQLDSTAVLVSNLRMSSGEQQMSLSGKMGREQTDTIRVDFNRFDVAPASALISELGYRLSGTVSGKARAQALFGQTVFDALLDFDSLHINDFALGTPSIVSEWNSDKKRVDIRVREQSGRVPITGYFDIANSRYYADIQFPHFNLILLEPLIKGILVNTSGEADVHLTLNGEKDKPLLNGRVDIKRYNLQVDYTKARYSTSGRVEVIDNRFEALRLPVSDSLRGTAILNAHLASEYFKNLTFGVNVGFSNLLALNTTVRDNEIFYGRAFGTGELSIVGSERNTTLNINAATALDSEFNLPFTGVSTIEEAKFITFIDSTTLATAPESRNAQRPTLRQDISRISYTNELDIRINLNVLPNTRARISMINDYIANNINGVGVGNFNIHINPEQDIFTMNGSYQIQKGSYQFNLKTVKIFDKILTMEPGGTITWTGDPADPIVNLDAVYRLKASLQPLTGTVLYQGSNVNVECGINLTGKLFEPTLNLSITAPGSDPETQNVLRNYLNTQEVITNQFLSLLLARTFMPDMSTASMGNMGSSLVGAAGLEYLLNQVNNLISNDRFDIRLGVRPRTENTSDEVSVNFSTAIIPDKLLLEAGGTYNTRNNPVYVRRAPFSGEGYLTYILNKAGSLQLKGFTRVIERFDETQGLQETGIGLYYRKDFQTFSDLFLKANKRQQQKQQQKK